MNALTKALNKKMGKTDAKGLQKVKDFFTGTSRLNNRTNSGSAYSMMDRKIKNTAPAAKQSGYSPKKYYE